METTAKTQTETGQLHGGRLVARRLKANGISTVFTLSGGHLFSIYDGCKEEGIKLVDTRHEQSAAFAAEGWAKATREIGVCALTAGPGVTNGMSAMASAGQNNSPMLLLGGRAPQLRWGQGSLQEIDHVPFVRPVTKSAETAIEAAAIPGLVDQAIQTALEVPTGPTFVDFPLDIVFSEATYDDQPAELPDPREAPAGDGGGIERAAALLARAERPVIMAGTGVYWGHAEEALAGLIGELGIPTFTSGMARGSVPADHECFLSRVRGRALKEADVALAIGVPLDFRLGFGGAFGDDTDVVRIDFVKPEHEAQRELAVEIYGGIHATLKALEEAAIQAGAKRDRAEAWLESLRSEEETKRAGEEADLSDDRAPLHPLRVYRELNEVLDADTTVVGDGGDFVSYAGRVIESYKPGRWMDPGPFGCLGAGPGYAMAAQLARPGSQVALLLGDGAFGFSGMEFDTMVRHKLPVVAIVGNNGIWALEKHPMEFVYGYSVVAELRPATRYDEVVRALGGHGELVERPEELRPALDRAFSSGLPACVNVLTDPEVVYPRKANLA